jgi:hypothetical protein
MFFQAWRECLEFMRSARVDVTRALLRERLAAGMFRHMLNTFRVSRSAMAIRCMELGLFRRSGAEGLVAARESAPESRVSVDAMGIRL